MTSMNDDLTNTPGLNVKPNSHKYKAEQKEANERQRPDKIVAGSVKVKKKNELHKFADVFIAEDTANVKNYILMDVLVPAIKKAISDIIVNGIDMLLYGETGHSKKKSTASGNISYNRFYDERKDDGRSMSTTRSRSGYAYDTVIIESRAEAQEVLTQMDEIIDMYGSVRVADFYDLVGVTGDYTDNKYGWSSIQTAEIVRMRDGSGYIIKLPKATPINQ